MQAVQYRMTKRCEQQKEKKKHEFGTGSTKFAYFVNEKYSKYQTISI